MSDDTSRLHKFNDTGRIGIPPDLAAVALLTAVAMLMSVTPLVRYSLLRIILGICLALFFFGYAITAALFPRRSNDEIGGIDGAERVALSVLLSVATVPLVILALTFTHWGVSFSSAATAVGGLTEITTAVAVVRRASVQPDERFAIPIRKRARSVYKSTVKPTRLEASANVVLALALMFALIGTGYSMVAEDSNDAFSELYLLSKTADGDLSAENYPTTFAKGETRSIVVGVGNHENRPMEYTVVTVLQRVERDGETMEIVESKELARYDVRLKPDETDRRSVTLEPTMVGDHLRVAFYLHKRTPRSDQKNPYRQVHLWITVRPNGDTASVAADKRPSHEYGCKCSRRTPVTLDANARSGSRLATGASLGLNDQENRVIQAVQEK
ncbi:DUF1616 domain-containing protein [Haladaptatus salinisoli]|uniref:DUF1616 domain-containing protein n=1 Tax=Haladaptatus salinisoli TaxID=2884876 RepID=UPI001D0A089C|nr:DUF1616 domain-containing protein [Haladaptatus salinisoli]